MLIEISFRKIGYALQIGHEAGLSEQTWNLSLVKEWYGKDEDGKKSVTYAKVIFHFGGKK